MIKVKRLLTMWTVSAAMAALTAIAFYFTQVWLVRTLIDHVKEVEKNRDEWKEARLKSYRRDK